MDGRIISCLLLLLIIFDFVHSAPKINGNHKSNNLKITNKEPIKGSKKSLRQGLSQSIEEYSQETLEEQISDKAEKTDQDASRDNSDENVDNAEDKSKAAEKDEQEGENADGDAAKEEPGEDTSETVKEDKDDHKSVPDSNENAKDSGGSKTRSLRVGDTFTTTEMLEVTRRLIKKVKQGGKGIVSSAKNAYELADRLFEAFFMTLKRIVLVRAADISALDALQALSLSGDVVDKLRATTYSFTEAPSVMYGGFHLKPNTELYDSEPEDNARKCHYKVLRKMVEKKTGLKKKPNRRQKILAAKIIKKLGKNRNLVVNPGRRELEKKNKNKKTNHYDNKNTNIKKKNVRNSKNKKAPQASRNKAKTSKKKSVPRVNVKRHGKKKDKKRHAQLRNVATNKLQNKTEPICRWMYACSEPTRLKTCRLHPVCKLNATEIEDDFYVQHSEAEHTESLRKFRKMVGVDPIDEEVEKILQAHILSLRPLQLNAETDIESLAEYFNKIIQTDLKATTPMPTADSTSNEKQKQNVLQGSIDIEYEGENEDDQARRILGLKPKGRNATTITNNKKMKS